MNKLISLVVLAASIPASAASFSLDSVTAAELRSAASVAAPRGVPLAAPRAVEFTLEITRHCDSGVQILATWCPKPGSGVVGGLEKVVRAKVGDVVVFHLVNRFLVGGSHHGVGTHGLRFTAADDIQRCSGAACAEFGVDAKVRLGGHGVASFTADKPGRFKYYDPYWLNGYGVLEVAP